MPNDKSCLEIVLPLRDRTARHNMSDLAGYERHLKTILPRTGNYSLAKPLNLTPRGKKREFVPVTVTRLRG